MRSFIKIYGPPIFEAVRALEKIASEMPETCITDILIASSIPPLDTSDVLYRNLTEIGVTTSKTECDKMISKSGQMLGEYDFFFEWQGHQSQADIAGLIMTIDAALAPLGCKYTITTRK